MNEPSQDRAVVLAVIIFVGVVAAGGLTGIVYLVAVHADASSLLAVSGPATTALGILGGLLARTSSGTQAAEQRGHAKAVEEFKQLEPAPSPAPTDTPPLAPAEPLPSTPTDPAAV